MTPKILVPKAVSAAMGTSKTGFIPDPDNSSINQKFIVFNQVHLTSFEVYKVILSDEWGKTK